MIINEKILPEVLAVAMSGGADFAEIFAQRSRNNSISYIGAKIDSINDNVISGVGIRAFLDTKNRLRFNYRHKQRRTFEMRRKCCGGYG